MLLAFSTRNALLTFPLEPYTLFKTKRIRTENPGPNPAPVTSSFMYYRNNLTSVSLYFHKCKIGIIYLGETWGKCLAQSKCSVITGYHSLSQA